MKKGEIVLLISGLVSLVIAVLLSVVTAFVFLRTAKAQLGKTTIREGIEWGTDMLQKYSGADKIVISGADGDTVFDISNGLRLESVDGSGVKIEHGTVRVTSNDGDEVYVGAEGISISSAD